MKAKVKGKKDDPDGMFRHPFRTGWRLRNKAYMSWLHKNLGRSIPVPNIYSQLPQGGSVQLHHTKHPYGKPRDNDAGVFPLPADTHTFLEQNPQFEKNFLQAIFSAAFYWVYSTQQQEGEELTLETLTADHGAAYIAWVVEKLHEGDGCQK